MTDPKIIVLMPTRGLIVTLAEASLDRELSENRQVPIILRTYDLPLPLSRNYLVETALKQDWWTHVLMIDDDVILPEGGLKEMIKLNADIAVMDYPIHVKVEGEFAGTVVRDNDGSVAYAGLGATLVKREVLEKMEQPWFVLTQYRVNRGPKGEIGFYAAQADGSVEMSAGEDTHFFLIARKKGFSVKVCKKTAAHARIDQMITTTHNNRYSRQHTITHNDKIEREMV